MGDLETYKENPEIYGTSKPETIKTSHGFVYAIKLNNDYVKIGETLYVKTRVQDVLKDIGKVYPDLVPYTVECWYWNTPIREHIEKRVKDRCKAKSISVTKNPIPLNPPNTTKYKTEIFNIPWRKFLNIVRDVVLYESVNFKLIYLNDQVFRNVSGFINDPVFNLDDISPLVFKLKL